MALDYFSHSLEVIIQGTFAMVMSTESKASGITGAHQLISLRFIFPFSCISVHTQANTNVHLHIPKIVTSPLSGRPWFKSCGLDL